MSTQYPRDPDDPLALVPFSPTLLDEASQEAKASPRHRSIIRLHEHSDKVQRMFNAVEPYSYARPHRHSNPDKAEVFVALRGSLLVVRYNYAGAPIEGFIVSSTGTLRGVEIPAGAWHSIVALEEGTVVFEMIEGP